MREADFTAFCKQNLMPLLNNFDKRKRKLHLFRLMNTLLFITAGAVVYLALELAGYGWSAYLLLALPVLALFIMGVIKRYRLKKELRHEYKTRVVNEIVKFADPSLEFNYQQHIPMSEYTRSGIFRQRVDRMRGEDYISGRLGKTDIVFSELHTEYKTVSTDSNGNTKERWHTIFKGVFLIADFHKNFNTETYVLVDRWERFLGRFARRLQGISSGGRGKIVELENPDFEKVFKVYSQDQIEARYILSPSMMERVLNFREKTGRPISLSFVNSKMYVAIPMRKDLFEPRWNGSNANIPHLLESFNYILLFTGIVEELNLNTRIWTKQ